MLTLGGARLLVRASCSWIQRWAYWWDRRSASGDVGLEDTCVSPIGQQEPDQPENRPHRRVNGPSGGGALLSGFLAALLFGVWLWFLTTPIWARYWVSFLEVTAPDLTARRFRDTKSGTSA